MGCRAGTSLTVASGHSNANLAEEVWQAVRSHLPRRVHQTVARDIVQLFEDDGDIIPKYGKHTLYEAAGMDDEDEQESDDDDDGGIECTAADTLDEGGV